MGDQSWIPAVRFLTFSLRKPGGYSVLAEGHSLVVDRLLGTLTLVNWQDEQFIAVCDELTDEQFTLVLLLLETWPSYVSYKQLLSHIGIQPSHQAQEDFAQVRMGMRGDEAEAIYEQACARLQPLFQTLRDSISGCKASLTNLGIEIAAVTDYGWFLVTYVEQGRK